LISEFKYRILPILVLILILLTVLLLPQSEPLLEVNILVCFQEWAHHQQALLEIFVSIIRKVPFGLVVLGEGLHAVSLLNHFLVKSLPLRINTSPKLLSNFLCLKMIDINILSKPNNSMTHTHPSATGLAVVRITPALEVKYCEPLDVIILGLLECNHIIR